MTAPTELTPTEPARTESVPTAPPSGFHALRVSRIDRLCEDAVAVTFDVPDDLAEHYRFRAGQYLTIRLVTGDGEQRRSYSICAPEGAAPRIGVRRVADGLFSEWLVDALEVGEAVEVGPPEGRFVLDPSPTERDQQHGQHGQRHVLIAAGSGITPILAIASTALDADPANRVTVLYGNRRSDTVMFGEELADLKDRYGPRVQLVHVLSREPMEAEIFGGRLDADKLRMLLGALLPVGEIAHWWLCGPFGLVTDAQEVLADVGVPRDRVHRELFYVAEDGPPPPPPVRSEEDGEVTGAAGTVTLNGRSTTVTFPSDGRVLDAAQRFRSDLPFACRGGVCGTCRARITDGEVRMVRNFALEPEEVDAGYVLTCQSVPVSETLAVDFDV